MASQETSPVVQVQDNERDFAPREAVPRGHVDFGPNSLGDGCPIHAGVRVGSPVSLVSECNLRGKPEFFADYFTRETQFWRWKSDIEKDRIAAAFRVKLTRVQV